MTPVATLAVDPPGQAAASLGAPAARGAAKAAPGASGPPSSGMAAESFGAGWKRLVEMMGPHAPAAEAEEADEGSLAGRGNTARNAAEPAEADGLPSPAVALARPRVVNANLSAPQALSSARSSPGAGAARAVAQEPAVSAASRTDAQPASPAVSSRKSPGKKGGDPEAANPQRHANGAAIPAAAGGDPVLPLPNSLAAQGSPEKPPATANASHGRPGLKEAQAASLSALGPAESRPEEYAAAWAALHPENAHPASAARSEEGNEADREQTFPEPAFSHTSAHASLSLPAAAEAPGSSAGQPGAARGGAAPGVENPLPSAAQAFVAGSPAEASALAGASSGAGAKPAAGPKGQPRITKESFASGTQSEWGPAVTDSAAMARAASGANGWHQDAPLETSNAARNAAVSPHAGAGSLFASLDGDVGPRGVSWVHAGPQRAEAGFEDSTLGWVGVRADLAGGGVHAAIVPGTADAAQALGAHMAGLNAHLTEQHIAVETLTLGTAPGSGAGASADSGSMQQGEGQGQAASGTGSPAPAAGSAETDAAGREAAPAGADTVAPLSGLAEQHISVMA